MEVIQQGGYPGQAPGWRNTLGVTVNPTMNLSLYRRRTTLEPQASTDDEVCTVKVGHGWDLAEIVGEPGVWVARDRKLLQMMAYLACDRVTGSKSGIPNSFLLKE